MTEPNTTIFQNAREEFDQRVHSIRPNLHRYCTRMTGSVVDAEDVVQEALAKAYYLLPTSNVSNLEGWLFRIVHNKAIDHLRKVERGHMDSLEDFPLQEESAPPLEDKELATFALSVFLQLTPMQRSCVILKDVIGNSLAEISEMLDVSVGAIKASLHRGRDALRKLAKTVEPDIPLNLKEPEASLLSKYVDHFNARDFDAIRAMLADDVRLDLVERTKLQGAVEVGTYFHNYDKKQDWLLSLGFVEGAPAILISNPEENSTAIGYFIFIEWQEGKIASIRDYRYSRYVMIDADIVESPPSLLSNLQETSDLKRSCGTTAMGTNSISKSGSTNPGI